MKLNELRQLIETSSKTSEKIDKMLQSKTYTLEEYRAQKKDLDVMIEKIENLLHQGKLNISVDLLRENIKEYFDKKGALMTTLSVSQYTAQDDYYVTMAGKEHIINANSLGTIGVVFRTNATFEENEKTQIKAYELFDIKNTIFTNVSFQYTDKYPNGVWVDGGNPSISILDLVPSFKTGSKQRHSQLLADYPDIVDVFYQTLEEYQQDKAYKSSTRFINHMINEKRYDEIKQQLDLIEQTEQEGFNY